MTHFEKLILSEKNVNTIVQIVEREAEELEARYGMIFTYQAVAMLVDAAGRYFSEVNLLEKSVSLLEEIVPYISRKKKIVIQKHDVIEFVKMLTGIPMGEIDDSERSTLVNLEDVLHKRVIGQGEAVKAVAEAMKRARADVESRKRPMGSFLFLGPTGVGKTETVKALAEAFFKDENSVIRLDMSEYQTGDALERLIGSYSANKPGALASRLREKPYGVLLLDEFEKTSTAVLDLFLQILDEGFFSDATGKKVNARNLIIIATSNAGSDIIIDTLGKKLSLVDSKQSIVEEIIHRGTFKPELLNRFDDVIMFEPLHADALLEVAKLQLQKLSKRLEEKGIRLKVSEELAQYIAVIGMHDSFGARSMNRAIQDKVESLIATAMIEGKIRSGNDITIVKNTDADYKIKPLALKVIK
jgi:ATP-dependent Clp protease ATP-binding subunit ClpA